MTNKSTNPLPLPVAWCKPPEKPTLCLACNTPAEGYTQETAIATKQVWRRGVCHKCYPPSARGRRSWIAYSRYSEAWFSRLSKPRNGEIFTVMGNVIEQSNGRPSQS